MLQIIVKVVSLQNGSMNAVSATGMTSMSDSLIACQPRMLEPSKPRPSSKTASSRASAGIVKCCQSPGKSMKRRSTALTSFSRIRARTSFGVTRNDLQLDGTLPQPRRQAHKGIADYNATARYRNGASNAHMKMRTGGTEILSNGAVIRRVWEQA